MPEQDLPRQIDELRQLIVRLSRLVEVSVTLNSTLEPEPLLQFLIRSAADLLDSEAASILLFDEKTQRLYFAASTGADPTELRKIPVPLEGSIAGTIYRDDSPLIINEVAADPRHYRQVGEKIRFEARTMIGVPMRMRDRRIGVLEALNKRGGPFTESDLQTLSIIASQAAVAIHNANLVSALQKAYDELGKVEKLKSDFIAIASHELRTPLGVILGYAAILKEDADQATSEHAAAVLHSALRMRALIEDMTNMNMMRVGSAELAVSLQALQPILEAAYEEMRPLIEAKGQQVARHVRARAAAGQRRRPEDDDGADQPAQQRHALHARRRADRARARAAWGRSVAASGRQRGRPAGRPAGADIRSVLPGGAPHDPPPRRDGAGSVHRARRRAGAQRAGVGGERRTGSGRHVHHRRAPLLKPTP